MALDLSVKSMGHFVDVGSYSGEEESSSSDSDSDPEGMMKIAVFSGEHSTEGD